MDYDLNPIDSLIDEIKGTTGFLSSIFSTKNYVFFIVVIFGTILSINLLLN